MVSIGQLLPKHIFRPDDAFPVSRLGLPATAKMTRIGFDHKPGQLLSFEGETQVKVRMEERLWRYKIKPAQKDGKMKGQTPEIRQSRRWRLEILVDAKNSDPVQ